MYAEQLLKVYKPKRDKVNMQIKVGEQSDTEQGALRSLRTKLLQGFRWEGTAIGIERGKKKKQKCFRYWHFWQVVQFLHLLPCCSECSVTAFEPKICSCFFQYIMCLLAEGSYPQGLAVTYFQALAQEVNIVQLKSSRHSRVDLSYHTLYGWVL